MKFLFIVLVFLAFPLSASADDASSRSQYWLHRSIKKSDFKKQVGAAPEGSMKKAHKEALFFVFTLQGLRFLDGDIRCGGVCGKFWDKWGSAFSNLDRWPDGDSPETNYLEHGWIEGATFISVYMQNNAYCKNGEDKIKILSKQYLKTIGKATLFAGVWSTEFEIGPISESTIGPDRYNKNGIVDYIITPVGGALTATGELIIYRKATVPMLRSKYRVVRVLGKVSSTLTPGRSFANLMRGKPPWKSWQD